MANQETLLHIGLQQGAAQLANLLTLPSWISYQLLSRGMSAPRACLTISKQAAAWSGPASNLLRRSLYRRILAEMGKEVTISMGTIISKPTLTLGDLVYIGTFCNIGDAHIGAYTMLADHVSVVSGQHGLAAGPLMRTQPSTYQRITIGQDCWIGTRSVVMADVGDHAVVGAGSVVTKSVAPYAIVVGNPARQIADRRERDQQKGAFPNPADARGSEKAIPSFWTLPQPAVARIEETVGARKGEQS
ncbi:MAG: acyltransferase [Caldilineaceae bacterium]